MKVSIIIETDSVHVFDDIPIEECLKAIANQTYPREKMEFLIVDGGKVANLQTIAASLLPEAQILKLPSSTKSQQKNFGLTHATCDVIAFVDADCAPPKNWVEKIVTMLAASPSEVAGIQGITQLTNRVLSREVSALFYGNRHGIDPTTSSRLVTDNCAFRKEILTKFKFEHSEFSTVSDTLLLLRLKQAGYRMLLCRDLGMAHSFPGWTSDGFGWFFGRAFGVGYYMVKARQIVPELRGSVLVRRAAGFGWPILWVAKWLLDLKQIWQSREIFKASFMKALPLTFLYHPTLFFGGMSALLRMRPPHWT